MRRANMPLLSQQTKYMSYQQPNHQQLPVNSSRYLMYNNRQHYNNNNNSNSGMDYNKDTLVEKLVNTKTEKLQAAREAREKLDLYRSFEQDEDNEFYPHQQQYGNYQLDNNNLSSGSLISSFKPASASTIDYNSTRFNQQQQQPSKFRSPLSTPERTKFQTNLSSNRLYSTNITNNNDFYYSSPSPQRLNASVIHNGIATPLSNRLSGRPQTGQLYYAPQYNRSKY